MKNRLDFSLSGQQQLTEFFEGCKLTSYPDPGTGGAPWTIGYGHTGPDVKKGMMCTKEQAERWLHFDVQSAVSAVNNYVSVQLSQHQFDACVDFVFNAGSGNFKSSTLLKLINVGDFVGASKEFDKWVKSGGRVLAGLVKRRDAEEAWFKTTD